MRLALYQPDIPQNAGAMMRTAACLGVAVDVIEPCGFVFGDRGLRRAAMDYLGEVDLSRHSSWEKFMEARSSAAAGRLVLLTTRADCPYAAFDFHAGNKKTAPTWMQKNGLEWVFRLYQEPGRLWRRYLVTNTLFVQQLLRQWLTGNLRFGAQNNHNVSKNSAHT